MSQYPAQDQPPLGRRVVPNPRKAVPTYDPLNTVRLPPPSSASDSGYEWVGGNSGQFRSHMGMLKTPDSIIRPGEEYGPKRVSIPSDSTSKRRRQTTPDSVLMPDDKRHLRNVTNVTMPETHTNNSGQWSAYFSRAFPGFEFSSGSRARVPTTNGAGQYMSNGGPANYGPNQAYRHSSGATMLSPNSPHNVLEAGNYEFTPTRSDRPQSVASGMEYYDTIMAERNATFVLPHRSSHAMMPLNAQRYDSMELRQPMTERKYVEVPPPEKMPVVEDDGKKPSYSYAMLIGMAILRAPGRKLTLAQIYSWIMDTFAYYRESKPAWHNSIRHNLSLNKAFQKRIRPKEEPGKGSYWTIVEGHEYQFYKPHKPKKLEASDDSIDDGAAAAIESRNRDVSGEQQRQEPAPRNGKFSRPSNDHDDSKFANSSSTTSSSKYQDSIPSDGTEPDDRFIEEREKQTRPDSSPDKSTPAEHSPSGNELPQMHMMSRPTSRSSQAQTFENLLGSHESARPDSAPLEHRASHLSSSRLSRATTSKSGSIRPPVANSVFQEWRGQGEYAFRCSTPSMLRDNPGKPSISVDEIPPAMPPNFSENILAEDLHSPQQISEPNSQSKSLSSQGSLSVHEGKPSIRLESPATKNDGHSRDSTSRKYQADHYESEFTDHSMPRTPEKVSRVSINAPSSGKPKVQFLRPTMLHCQSLESSFAGTLDLSPGISYGDDQGIYTDQRKATMLNNLPDFLDFGFHHTFDKNAPRMSEVSTPSRPISGPSSVLGSATHGNGIFMPLDFDLSPAKVVTPVRRPFDTPIRDLSQAYSPYCRSSNFAGSPLKRK